MGCNKYVAGINDPCGTCIEPCEDKIRIYLKQIKQDIKSSVQNFKKSSIEDNAKIIMKTANDYLNKITDDKHIEIKIIEIDKKSGSIKFEFIALDNVGEVLIEQMKTT